MVVTVLQQPRQNPSKILLGLCLLIGFLAIPQSALPSDWDYEGARGPHHWGDIHGFEACASGHEQSPINIEPKQHDGVLNLQTDYNLSLLSVSNNGHTVLVEQESGSQLQIGEKTYQLLQYHFHAPSENNLFGTEYPMELHFVHRDDTGHLAVLAVFIEQGFSDHGEADLILQNIPPKGKKYISQSRYKIDPNAFLPNIFDYYHFKGSLTTPPCTEGVEWQVLKTPILFSEKQINLFKMR